MQTQLRTFLREDHETQEIRWTIDKWDLIKLRNASVRQKEHSVEWWKNPQYSRKVLLAVHLIVNGTEKVQRIKKLKIQENKKNCDLEKSRGTELNDLKISPNG